jgi:type IV pilus assembly protein PilF
MPARKIIFLICCAHFAFCASSQQKLQQARAKDPKYQYNLGLVYLNQSNLNPANIDTAISYFVKALALDTRYYLAWNAIGLAQSLKGNRNEAARAYEKCLEIYPEFTEVRNNLGMIYQELGQLDKAEAQWQKALADMAYPSRENLYYNLAGLYVVKDRLDLAYDNIQRALQVRPRMAMAHNRKGKILERMNKLEEAEAAYEQAVKIVPDDVRFSFDLGAAYVKTGEVAKAKDLFLKLAPRVTDPDMKAKVGQYLRDLAAKAPGEE